MLVTMPDEDAKLYVLAKEQCKKINPNNPQVVAENIEALFKNLKDSQENLEEILGLVMELKKHYDNYGVFDDLQDEVEGIINQNEKLLGKLEQ